MSLPSINQLFLQYQTKTSNSENLPLNCPELSPVKRIDYEEEVVPVSGEGRTVEEDSAKFAAVEAILELSCKLNDIHDVDEGPVSDNEGQRVVAEVVNSSAQIQYTHLTEMDCTNTYCTSSEEIFMTPQDARSTVVGDIATSVNEVNMGMETPKADSVVTVSASFDENELMSSPTVFNMLQNPEMCILEQFESAPRQEDTTLDSNSKRQDIVHLMSKTSEQGPYNLVVGLNSPEKQRNLQYDYIETSNNRLPNMKLLPTEERRDGTMDIACRSEPLKRTKPDYSFMLGGRCMCGVVDAGDEAPADEVFIKDGQMYRLQDVAVIVIGDLEFYAFLKEKMCFIPLAIVYKYTGLAVKQLIEKGLLSQDLNLLELHENESELLKQKCGLGHRTSFTHLIALDDLRQICKRLSLVHSYPVLDTIAAASMLFKVSGSEMKCCNCGLTTKDACSAQYAPVSDVVYGGNELAQTSNKVSSTIGTLLVNDVSFVVFKVETKLYVCLKELIWKRLFTLAWLKNKLLKLKCTPIKAPEDIEIHLKLTNSLVQNSLWIDIFHVRCLCLTEKIHFFQRRLDLVKSMTNECYEYSPHTSLYCEKPLEQPTSYTINANTLEITTDSEVENESPLSFKIQYTSRSSGRKPTIKKFDSNGCALKPKEAKMVVSTHENLPSTEGNSAVGCVDQMACSPHKTYLNSCNKKHTEPKSFMMGKSSNCKKVLSESTLDKPPISPRRELTEATNNLVVSECLNNDQIESGEQNTACDVNLPCSENIEHKSQNAKPAQNKVTKRLTKCKSKREIPGVCVVVDKFIKSRPRNRKAKNCVDEDNLMKCGSQSENHVTDVNVDILSKCESEIKSPDENIDKQAEIKSPGEYIVVDKQTQGICPGEYIVLDTQTQGICPGEYIVPDKQKERKSPGEYIVPDKQTQGKSPGEYIVLDTQTQGKSPGEYIVLDTQTQGKSPGEYIVLDTQTQGKSPGEYIVLDTQTQGKSPGEYIVLDTQTQEKSPGEYIVPDKQTEEKSLGEDIVVNQVIQRESQRQQTGVYNPVNKTVQCESSKENSRTTIVSDKITKRGADEEHLNGLPPNIISSSSLFANIKTRQQTIEENCNISNMQCKMKRLQMSESGEITVENTAQVENIPNDDLRYESKRKSFSPRKLLRPRSGDNLNKKNSVEDQNLTAEASSKGYIEIEMCSSVKGSKTKSERVRSEGQKLSTSAVDTSPSTSTSLLNTIEKLKNSLTQSPKRAEIAARIAPQLQPNVLDLTECDIESGDIGMKWEKTVKQENKLRVENYVNNPEAGFSKEATHPRTSSERSINNLEGSSRKGAERTKGNQSDLKPDMIKRFMHNENGLWQLNVKKVANSEKTPIDSVTQDVDIHSETVNAAQIPMQQPSRKRGRLCKRKRTSSAGESEENKQPMKVRSSHDGEVIKIAVKNEEDVRSAMRTAMEEKLKQHVLFSLCCDPYPQFKAVGFKPGAERVFPVLFDADPESPSVVQLRENFLQGAARFMNKKFLLTVNETWKDVKTETNDLKHGGQAGDTRHVT